MRWTRELEEVAFALTKPYQRGSVDSFGSIGAFTLQLL